MVAEKDLRLEIRLHLGEEGVVVVVEVVVEAEVGKTLHLEEVMASSVTSAAPIHYTKSTYQLIVLDVSSKQRVAQIITMAA